MFVAVKFETYNSFLLGDTAVFIPLGRYAQKVGFPRSGHKLPFLSKATKTLILSGETTQMLLIYLS